jgi:hypothetical protein
MKFLKLFEQYFTSVDKEYKLADDKYNKILFRWFEICFYESNDKRYGRITEEQFSMLSQESKDYLLATLDVIKEYDPQYIRLGKLLDSQTNVPLKTDYQKIAHLTGNYFSGFGRGSAVLGSSNDIKGGLQLLMPPNQEVVDNIDEVFRKLKFKYI